MLRKLGDREQEVYGTPFGMIMSVSVNPREILAKIVVNQPTEDHRDELPRKPPSLAISRTPRAVFNSVFAMAQSASSCLPWHNNFPAPLLRV